MSEFGDRLRAIRIDQGLNQAELADKMGLAQASISQFEKNQRLPTPALVEKFAKELGVSKEELAGADDQVFENTMLMRNLETLPPEVRQQIKSLVASFKKIQKDKTEP